MTPILILVALALALYAFYELAPRQWAATVRGFRTALTAAPAAPPETPSRPSSQADDQRLTGASILLRTHPWLLTIAAPLAIVALTLGLRVIDLTGSPFGFFCDEASNALDAYWIGHTFHDQHGALLPAYFQALGDWRGGFSVYWEVPFVALFGLNEFAARLSSAAAGTLTVWLTYLFVSKAYNRAIGLGAAFLLATSPWHIMWSRPGWEIISLPLGTALCLTFLYLGLERPRWLPLAFAFGAVGIYTYQPARVFFPFFCLAWIAIYARTLVRHWRLSLVGVVLGAIVLIPTVLSLLDGTFFARITAVAGPSQSLAQRAAFFWDSYRAHFSWHFLFETMTPEEWITRHFVRGFGMLYPVEAPFLIVGIVAMIVRRRPPDLLFLAWFLIYPIGTALVATPVSHRSIAGVIVFQIAVAQGAYLSCKGLAWLAARVAVLRNSRQMVLTGATALLLVVGLISTSGFMNAYLHDYPQYSAGWDGWQSGPKQILTYFAAHRGDYDQQYINVDYNATDELVRFYMAPRVTVCDTCMLNDNSYFTACNCSLINVADANLVNATYSAARRQLWVATPDEVAQSRLNAVPHRIVHSLAYPNGQTAFLFVATGPST